MANQDTEHKIVSMSFGGQRNQGTDDAVDAAAALGVLMVAAAGNDLRDACLYSPAGAKGVCHGQCTHTHTHTHTPYTRAHTSRAPAHTQHTYTVV